jgi:hypothetical protein
MLEENEKETKQIDPEAKKIDTMLKVGVLMVGISGLIFATTSWEVISDLMKVVALIIMAALFYGLSKFSELKLKLDKTTITYWILSMIFIIFAFLCAGYFKIFGEYFSLNGSGNGLFRTVLWLLVAVLSFLSYYSKFKYDSFLYGTYSGLSAALATYLHFIEMGTQEILVIFISLMTLISLIRKDNKIFQCLNKFSIILSIVLWFLITPIVIIKDNGIISLVLRIITLISVYHITFIKKEKGVEIIAPFILLLILYKPLENIWNISSLTVQAFIYAVLYFILLVTKSFSKNRRFEEIFTCLVNFSLLVLFFIIYQRGEHLNGIFIALSALVNNVMYELTRQKDDGYSLEHYLQPYKILMISYAIINYIFIDLSVMWNLIIECFVMLLLYFITKESKLKYTYFIVYFVLAVLTVMSSAEIVDEIASNSSGLIQAFLLLIISLVPFCISKMEDNQYNNFEVPSFILLLYSLMLFVFNNNVFTISEMAKSIILLVIYFALAFAYRKRKILYAISALATIIPYNFFLENITTSYEISAIITSAFYFLLVPIVSRVIEDAHERDKVEAIINIFIMLPVIFIDGLWIALYVGAVSLIMIIFGFAKKEYGLIFKTGVAFIIINIIFQLRELWLEIPFWLYLLVGGMVLIGVVMHKGIKNLKK